MAKKEETKSVAKYDERLAALAKASAKTEAHVGGGAYISCRGGQFSFGGNLIPGGKMQVIIIDHVAENAFYEGRYDPDDPSSPVCFSFFRDVSDAAPHEKSEKPQSDACKGCPHDEFGSADTGRGKACKNIRRLAIIMEDGMDDIENATVAFLKIPVTSVKGWATYVKQLADTMGLPPLGVITEMSITPDSSTQFKLSFKLVEKIEDEDVLTALLDKADAIKSDLENPYVPNSERTAPAPKGVKGARNARVQSPAPAAKASPKLRR